MDRTVRLRRDLGRLGGFLHHKAFVGLVVAILLLVLWGTVAERQFALALLALVAGRLLMLCSEALRPVRTAADVQNLHSQLIAAYAAMTSDELVIEAADLGLPGNATAREAADAAFAFAERAVPPPRPRRELACEALGLVTFVLLLPADVALLMRDMVSLNDRIEWVGAGILALGGALYLWPFRWLPGPTTRRWRMRWWSLAFVPALLLGIYGVRERHAYLDPTRADRLEIGARRALALPNNVDGSANAAWVFDYARLRAAQGDTAEADRLYTAGLRLAPFDHAAADELTALRASVGFAGGSPAQNREAHRPLWEDGQAAAAPPRCDLDTSLADIGRSVVVLVRIGEVPDMLVDAMGYAIKHELGIPVCVATPPLPLPPFSRPGGLMVGPQWDVDSLIKAFTRVAPPRISTPGIFVLVTPVQMYDRGNNFVFTSTYRWGSVISFAGLGDFDQHPSQVAHRAAKSAIGAVVTSIGVPRSPDPHCVTSYVSSLRGLDVQGNRPLPRTMMLFEKALQRRDRRWAARAAKARSQGG
jgi:hypothetical protein